MVSVDIIINYFSDLSYDNSRFLSIHAPKSACIVLNVITCASNAVSRTQYTEITRYKNVSFPYFVKAEPRPRASCP